MLYSYSTFSFPPDYSNLIEAPLRENAEVPLLDLRQAPS